MLSKNARMQEKLLNSNIICWGQQILWKLLTENVLWKKTVISMLTYSTSTLHLTHRLIDGWLKLKFWQTSFMFPFLAGVCLLPSITASFCLLRFVFVFDFGFVCMFFYSFLVLFPVSMFPFSVVFVFCRPLHPAYLLVFIFVFSFIFCLIYYY